MAENVLNFIVFVLFRYFPLIIFCLLLAYLSKNLLLFFNNLVTGYRTGKVDKEPSEYKRRKMHLTIIAYLFTIFVLILLQDPYDRILDAMRHMD
jgi:phosphatidylglycerophosphate synthase